MKKIILFLVTLCITSNTFSQNSWFNLEVQFDQWAPQESFTLLTQSGDTLLNYQPQTSYEFFQTIIYCDSGDVELSLYDSFGDGWLDGANTPSNILMYNGCQGVILDLDANFAFTQYDTTVNLLACPPPVLGCMDSNALNYDSLATIDDGSCSYPYLIPGCMDSTSSNFNPWAEVDNGTCQGANICSPGKSPIEIIFTPDNFGAESSWSLFGDYGLIFEAPQGTYTGNQPGVPISTFICVDELFLYDIVINDSYGDGLCGTCFGGTVNGNVQILDCLGNELFNLQDSIPDANFGNTFTSPQFLAPTTCTYVSPPLGCMDPMYVEYDPLACIDDGSCLTPRIEGCTDSSAFNYNPNANTSEILQGDYILQLLDGAADGWGGTWLGLKQGSWVSPQYYITPTDGGSLSFTIPLNSFQPVYAYLFTTPNSIVSLSQIAYNLKGPEGDTIIDVNLFNALPFPVILESDTLPQFGNTCIPVVEGCTDSSAFNYNSLANTDDGLCEAIVVGCMNILAFNYNLLANIDDPNSCIPVITGCMDPTSFNYNPLANTNDPSLCIPILLGCTNSTSFNYDANANTDDGSCIPIIEGCIDSNAYNYDPLANTDDGSCVPKIFGCTDPTMFNFDPLANVDDGSCVPKIYGCMDATAFNYDPLANTPNGSCIPVVFGCLDSIAFNFDPLANTDDGECISIIYGCTDPSALNYDLNANTEDFSCIPVVYGCMDSTAVNYDSLANVDNGTCITAIPGCTDPAAFNYNLLANLSDSTACNYDAGCITGPGEPYWLNNQCYAWVIDIDDYCCNNGWDPVCQELYNYCELGWPTGIDMEGRISDFEGIIVYPNPTKNIINITTLYDIEVKVYNMTGKLLNLSYNNNQIDLSNLSNGIYFLQIIHNNVQYNKRIIKE
tara:strand:- start:4680 stop:7370 length:2691 start_codon:yes stop_codon:yes gene_type:complete